MLARVGKLWTNTKYTCLT